MLRVSLLNWPEVATPFCSLSLSLDVVFPCTQTFSLHYFKKVTMWIQTGAAGIDAVSCSGQQTCWYCSGPRVLSWE